MKINEQLMKTYDQSEGGGPRTDYCTSWAREWTGGLAPVDAFFVVVVVAVAATRVYQSEGGGTRQEAGLRS